MRIDLRIGVFGGTFDPIHSGHLVIAEDVRLKLGLEEVLFMPAGQPWLKAERDVTEAAHRLEMAMLATALNPHFNVSTIELDRPGPTYTVDTIAELKSGVAAGAELCFILGLDALAELPQWKDPERLVNMCRLVGLRRPGYEKIDFRPLESGVPNASERVMMVDTPLIDVSATDIRSRVSRGISIRDLVPRVVEDYIAQHGLYRRGGKGADHGQ
ncbi:MAG: nicotinate-nucleotide adenylyltransferase [Dehalococcoidia bacterium]